MKILKPTVHTCNMCKDNISYNRYCAACHTTDIANKGTYNIKSLYVLFCKVANIDFAFSSFLWKIKRKHILQHVQGTSLGSILMLFVFILNFNSFLPCSITAVMT